MSKCPPRLDSFLISKESRFLPEKRRRGEGVRNNSRAISLSALVTCTFLLLLQPPVPTDAVHRDVLAEILSDPESVDARRFVLNVAVMKR